MSGQGDGLAVGSRFVQRNQIDGSLGTAVKDASQWFAFAASATVATGTGNLSFAGSGTATVAVAATGTGHLSLAGSGTAKVVVPAHGSGNLHFAGSATAGVVEPTSGTGHLSFAGSGTALVIIAASGHGALSFSGTGIAVIPVPVPPTPPASSTTTQGILATSGMRGIDLVGSRWSRQRSNMDAIEALYAAGEITDEEFAEHLSTPDETVRQIVAALRPVIRKEIEQAIKGSPDPRDFAEYRNRIYSVQLDALRAKGVTKIAWKGGTCKRCQINKAVSPIDINTFWPDGPPPIHKDCGCSVVPA